MNLQAIPTRTEGHHVEAMGSEQVLFGQARATAFFLNETAALVFSLCDGQRSVEAIVGLLADAYPESAAQVRADVLSVLGNLTAEGVLTLNG